jgi:hypothetical protein
MIDVLPSFKEKGWIKLPVEFMGIWYSPTYGGFSVYLRDRFNPEFPPDRLHEELGRDAFLPPHYGAKPTWVSKEEFEKEFGKVEIILVWSEDWYSNNHYPPTDSLIIYTEKYIVTLTEYDGNESFYAVPRDWRLLLDE